MSIAAVPTTSSVQDIRAQIEGVFKKQHANRWRIAQTTATQRIAKLKHLRQVILSHANELKEAMHADFRKSAVEVEISELQPVLAEIKHTIKHLPEWMRPTRMSTPLFLLGTKGMVRYEPKGVVLILSPWNYPFNLMMVPLLTAVAAGNCVMVRPSDKVPHTSRVIKKIIEAVFPEDEVACFTGPTSIANILLELPFDHVFFTGSPKIGRQVMAAASNYLAPVTLELGGKSPVFVDESADIEATAQRLMWGKFINAGQTCIAPDHVFVHESQESALLEACKRVITRFYGPDEESRRKNADFARIVDAANTTRLRDAIEKSVAKGAKIEIGGVVDVAERYVAPTLLSHVTGDMAIMEQEIFGPVLPFLRYRNLEDCFTQIRTRGKPLALYIFSNDDRNIETILANTTSGGTVINNCLLHFAHPDLPFGGVGESGMGNYHGRYGFITFSHERAVLVQGGLASTKLLYPPYTDKVKSLVSRMNKFLFGG